MALFRLPVLRGTIQEQNIVRTAASVGEALVAGAIFTIPAFMLAEVDGARLWPNLRDHYWEAVVILLVGGLIGVFFTGSSDGAIPKNPSVSCATIAVLI